VPEIADSLACWSLNARPAESALRRAKPTKWRNFTRIVAIPQDRRAALQAADEALSELRILLRQGNSLKLLTIGQYEHAARLADEVGRLIGGWRKAQARAATGQSDGAGNGEGA